MLGIIASDADTKKTSDFAFVVNFDLLRKFRDEGVAGEGEGVAGEGGEIACEDIVDVDAYDDISFHGRRSSDRFREHSKFYALITLKTLQDRIRLHPSSGTTAYFTRKQLRTPPPRTASQNA
jgi:hypothetical protein